MSLEDIFQDKVDLKARQKSLKAIKKAFHKIIEQVNKGVEPKLIIRKRTLANTIYDPERKLLLLGKEKLVRKFLDEGEARRFMQTILMASIIYEALANNEYPTIRDLFYRGKHTLPLATPRDKYKNTWEEQKESDAVLRDVEVITGKLREEMLILSKEKGKVVGNMKIRSGSDIIDLSRMGHGAYAIESTPDLIEFKDVDAEYVLIVEKDAVFQQLHRIGYWKKTRSILITSAGQPDRATRRFVRRLNEELKLPIYVLTDSIPEDEIVIARDPVTGKVFINPIKEVVEDFFTDKEKEWVTLPMEVPSWDKKTGSIKWSKIGYVYRHRISEPMIKIKTRDRGIIRTTKSHSLFVFRDGKIRIIPALSIKPGDYIIVANQLPKMKDYEENIVVLNIAEELVRIMKDEHKHQRILRSLRIKTSSREINLLEATKEEIDDSTEIVSPQLKQRLPNKIPLDRELAWLLGFLLANGINQGDGRVILRIKPEKKERIDEIKRALKNTLGIEPVIKHTDNNEAVVAINSTVHSILFEVLGLTVKAENRRIPSIILNAPSYIQEYFIDGLLEEAAEANNGYLEFTTRSDILAKQLFNMMLSLGVKPVLSENKGRSTLRIQVKKHNRSISEKRIAYKKTKEDNHEAIVRQYNIQRKNDAPIYESHLSKDSHSLPTKINSRLISQYGLLLTQVSQDYYTIVKGDVMLTEVIEVQEEEYQGYVYDFAVPITNSFVGGNGIVYHNSDPYGFYIYSVFKIGSITLSYESERLATPSARFLGVMMSDVFGDDVPLNEIYVSPKEIGGGKNIQLLRKEKKQRFLKALKKYNYKEKLDKKPFLSESERKNYIIKAKEQDLARAVELVGDKIYREFTSETLKITKGSKRTVKRSPGYPWFQDPRWIKELGIFFLTRSKLEIEAVSSKGLRFLAFEYLPTKIETGDWLD